MIRRFLSLLLLAWLLGLVWFAVFLPGPAEPVRTDAIIVLTGGPGRMRHAIDVLEAKQADRLLVSGVDRSVKRGEFEVAQNVPAHLSACCIDLGKDAVDTVTNARESAAWIRKHEFRTVRLVTTDWHMRRARFELQRALGDDATVIGDAVKSAPGMATLIREYNKFVARRIAVLMGL